MSTQPLPDGPDQDAMIGLFRERWPDAVTATIEGATFFSLDEKHWPNFGHATVRDELLPLIADAHDRLVAQHDRQRPVAR